MFARHLNATTGLANQRERREKRPRVALLKLPTLVAKNGIGAVAARGTARANGLALAGFRVVDPGTDPFAAADTRSNSTNSRP